MAMHREYMDSYYQDDKIIKIEIYIERKRFYEKN